MKTSVLKRFLPYVLTSAAVIILWWAQTRPEIYALAPQGKELMLLEWALHWIFAIKVVYWLALSNITILVISILYRKQYKVASWWLAISIPIFLIGDHYARKVCAESYYIVFVNQSVGEADIVRPLVKAGYAIGPLLDKVVTDKGLRNRRYAIEGLGLIRYEPAITTLRRIAQDTSEEVYLRTDAADAIQMITGIE